MCQLYEDRWNIKTGFRDLNRVSQLKQLTTEIMEHVRQLDPYHREITENPLKNHKQHNLSHLEKKQTDIVFKGKSPTL